MPPPHHMLHLEWDVVAMALPAIMDAGAHVGPLFLLHMTVDRGVLLTLVPLTMDHVWPSPLIPVPILSLPSVLPTACLPVGRLQFYVWRGGVTTTCSMNLLCLPSFVLTSLSQAVPF